MLRDAGYTWNDIAKVDGTSSTTMWRWLKENGAFITKYSEVSESALDYLVQRYQEKNPNSDELMFNELVNMEYHLV